VRQRIVLSGLVVLALLLRPPSTVAQEVTKVGTTAAKFLSIQVGPRALGMGGAYVSVATDATAMYWNPAGIARLENREFYVSHSEWLADLSFDYLGLVLPLGDLGAVGLNFTALTMPDMEITDELNPEGTGLTFSAGSFAVGLSFARNLTDRFSIGANVKYIVENIWNSSSKGIALDVGTLFNTPFKGIRLGASISNFGSKMRIQGEDLLVQKDIDESIAGNNETINAFLATDRFDLPLLLRIGISWDVLNTESSRLTLAVDGAHPNDNTEYLSIGGEYAMFGEVVFLRAGYRSIYLRDSEERFTVGAGINYDFVRGYNVALNYAFEQFDRLSNVHKFSVALQF
jgi:hypothetical protein